MGTLDRACQESKVALCDRAAQETRGRFDSLTAVLSLSLTLVSFRGGLQIKSTWGWRRWDPSGRWKPAEGRGNVGGTEGDGFEIVLDRVRLRLWRSEENWTEQ